MGGGGHRPRRGVEPAFGGRALVEAVDGLVACPLDKIDGSESHRNTLNIYVAAIQLWLGAGRSRT